MNRRIWIVLLVVVALLAVTPHLPQWAMAISLALHRTSIADVTADARSTIAQIGALANAAPWIIPAAAAALVVPVLALLVVRRRRIARVEAAVESPVLQMPRVESTVATIPAAARREAAPRSPRAGRRAAVHRLSARGQSVAEIARATRVGQDAVRFLIRAV
ncbi:MAG TPA: hypothetical protein VGL65_07290 [Gemmatimonadales bacterium]|jgi:hypothetical protein